jgi:hypothetical protein
MPQEEATQLAGVDEAFVLTDEEGFEVGAFGMGRSPWARTLCLEVLNKGPIKQGKEGAILSDDGIMVKHGGHDGLVKDAGSRYHNKQLLLWVDWFFLILCKGSLALVKGKGRKSSRSKSAASGDLLAPVLMWNGNEQGMLWNRFDAKRRHQFEF